MQSFYNSYEGSILDFSAILMLEVIGKKCDEIFYILKCFTRNFRIKDKAHFIIMIWQYSSSDKFVAWCQMTPSHQLPQYQQLIIVYQICLLNGKRSNGADEIVYHWWNMSPWWPLLGLMSRYPIFKWNHYNSFEHWAPTDLINRYPTFKWVAVTSFKDRVTGQ